MAGTLSLERMLEILPDESGLRRGSLSMTQGVKFTLT